MPPSDVEPTYRLLDSNNNVVAAFFADGSGNLELQNADGNSLLLTDNGIEFEDTDIEIGQSTSITDADIRHVAIGDGASIDTDVERGTAVGSGASCVFDSAGGIVSKNIGNTALGEDAEARGERGTALGARTLASDFKATAVGDSADATGQESVALGAAATETDVQVIKLGADGAFTHDTVVPGDLTVGGSKPFVIDHPSKPETHDLRHTCYEGPVAGGLVYQGTVTATDGSAKLTEIIPEYVINGDFGRGWTTHATPSDHFGNAYIDADTWTLHADTDGEYEVTVFGERDDPKALRNGGTRMERPKGERWDGSPRSYQRRPPHFDAKQYDDIADVLLFFGHTEDCDQTPCEGAAQYYRIEFADKSFAKIDVDIMRTFGANNGTNDSFEAEIDEIVTRARTQHND